MRIDERDVVFSRMARQPGTPAYEDYYSRHPEREELDRHMRALPPLGSPATPTFDPEVSPVVDGLFTLLAGFHPLADGPIAPEKMPGDAASYTAWAKKLALAAGASGAGALALTPDHYYSHRGRRDGQYGQPVTGFLPHALVLAVPMRTDLVGQAPKASEMAATVLGYLEAAKVALALAFAIRQAGFRGRAHIDGLYLMPLVRLAQESGLGVIGRNGLIITREHGPCVRLAAVDTDMPLLPGAPDPDEAKIIEFCRNCGLCAQRCPAIPNEPWPGNRPNADICHHTWRKLGTDCGRCIAHCPLTGWQVDWADLGSAPPGGG
ncbi:MAG: hypothetical protein LBV79_08640 [Candidatus Adiutrix sp.]|jgi:ferredoxin|nr:hypothetical protein [Candidatus Adiutrix sp.]